MNTEMIYTRRGFVKMAAGTVAAAALVAAGAESIDFSKAFASTTDGRKLGSAVAKADMEVGTWYSASVNLYVPAKLNFIVHMDAYLTNLTTPTGLVGAKPTTPVSDNGFVRLNSDGSYSVYVDEFNNTFGLLTIGGSENGGSANDESGVTAETQKTIEGWLNEMNRIDALSFTLPAGYTGSPTFDATEYANFMNFGDKTWAVTLQVDFNTLKTITNGVTAPAGI